MNIFPIFVVSQVIAISVIVVILKRILDGNLADLAIGQLESGRVNFKKSFDSPNVKFVVITHKKIDEIYRDRILKALAKNMAGKVEVDFQIDAKILGGMIIRFGDNTVDYSLIDRLRRAR